jgi:hypothetical protein
MLSATGVVLIVAGQSPASIIVLSLTVIAASMVALGAYRAFAPLVVPEGEHMPPLILGRTRAALEREKTLVLRSIKELEFDFAMKKVASSDFDELSARLRARAIGLMRQLDEGGGYKAEIEKELRHRLGAPTTKDKSSPEGQGFSPAAQEGFSPGDQRHEPRPEGALVGTAQDVAFRSCVCGTANDPDAKFCKNCGSRLVAG